MNKKNLTTQSGFTFIELMVGLVIGLFLIGALYQTFLSSQQTAIMSKGLNDVQENARFGLHFINRSVRDSGYSGCVSRIINNLQGNPNRILSNKRSLYGWNYTGTESTGAAFILSDANNVDTSLSTAKWQGVGNLPSFMRGRVAKGSDVLTFKGFTPLDANIAQHLNTNSSITTVKDHNLKTNSIVLIGDCNNAELFEYIGNNSRRIDLLSSGGKINNRSPQWRRKYNGNDKIHVYQSTFFYIGKSASGDMASLFRFSTRLPLSAVTESIFAAESQEIVEGIESLQILFGEDNNADTNPNNYVSAHQVSNWDNVVSTKIGLLIRSQNFADTNNKSSDRASIFTLLDGIKLTHNSKDPLLRYAVNTTVKLRNRGLHKDMTYHVCDSIDDAGANNNIPTCS